MEKSKKLERTREEYNEVGLERKNEDKRANLRIEERKKERKNKRK